MALTVLGVGLLFTMALLLAEPRIVRRIEAHEEALRAIDAALESLRATPGQPPSEIGPLEPGGEAAMGLRVSVRAWPLHPDGLFGVEASATYTVEGRAFEQSVETLFWRPEL